MRYTHKQSTPRISPNSHPEESGHCCQKSELFLLDSCNPPSTHSHSWPTKKKGVGRKGGAVRRPETSSSVYHQYSDCSWHKQSFPVPLDGLTHWFTVFLLAHTHTHKDLSCNVHLSFSHLHFTLNTSPCLCFVFALSTCLLFSHHSLALSPSWNFFLCSSSSVTSWSMALLLTSVIPDPSEERWRSREWWWSSRQETERHKPASFCKMDEA